MPILNYAGNLTEPETRSLVQTEADTALGPQKAHDNCRLNKGQLPGNKLGCRDVNSAEKKKNPTTKPP